MADLSAINAIAGKVIEGLTMKVEEEAMRLKSPFAITGHIFTEIHVVRVRLAKNGIVGSGEATGVYYLGETADGIVRALDRISDEIERGLSLQMIQSMLPPGGARNALDCAMWDFLAKDSGQRVWEICNVAPHPVTTVFTLGIDEPKVMGERAAAAARYPNLKIKLDADRPIERLEKVREARPDASLIIDVNQGWRFEEFLAFLPALEKLGIAMIEQPLPRGADDALSDFKSTIPLGADESCLHLEEFETAATRYDIVNIKLDKTGGLTEALMLIDAAKQRNIGLMVGNMVGSSLAMAPAHLVAQHCRFVDIDGPLLLASDIEHGLHYQDDGRVDCPSPLLWG